MVASLVCFKSVLNKIFSTLKIFCLCVARMGYLAQKELTVQNWSHTMSAASVCFGGGADRRVIQLFRLTPGEFGFVAAQDQPLRQTKPG